MALTRRFNASPPTYPLIRIFCKPSGPIPSLLYKIIFQILKSVLTSRIFGRKGRGVFLKQVGGVFAESQVLESQAWDPFGFMPGGLRVSGFYLGIEKS